MADDNGVVVGNILFSPVIFDDAIGVHGAIGFAPMEVVPERAKGEDWICNESSRCEDAEGNPLPLYCCAGAYGLLVALWVYSSIHIWR